MAVDPTEARWFRKQQASARAMLRIWERARREILGAIEESGPTDQSLTAGHRQAMLAQIDPIIARLQVETGILLFTRVKDGLSDGAASAAKEVAGIVGQRDLVVGLSRVNPALVEYHATRSAELVQAVTADLKSKIRLELANAQAQGLHAREAGRMIAAKTPLTTEGIRPVFPSVRARAETIARTEFAAAADTSFRKTLASAVDMGLPIGKDWSATLDSRTSKRCKGLHAKYNGHPIAVDAEFIAPDGKWRGQGAPAHPNCRSRTRARRLED